MGEKVVGSRHSARPKMLDSSLIYRVFQSASAAITRFSPEARVLVLERSVSDLMNEDRLGERMAGLALVEPHN